MKIEAGIAATGANALGSQLLPQMDLIGPAPAIGELMPSASNISLDAKQYFWVSDSTLTESKALMELCSGRADHQLP